MTRAAINVAKLRDVVSVRDYGAVCDGVTNDYAAIMSAHDNAPDGATIVIVGACKFTSPLVFTRRLNWFCAGPGDYFLADVGASNDAITITGNHIASDLQCKINLYSSSATACKDGLVLDRFWMSTMDARVQVGASGYAFKVVGALESRFYLRHTPNFNMPDSLPVRMAVNHLLVQRYTGSGGPYSTNASDFYVNFAGAGNGVVIQDQTNQGDCTYRGTVQGLTGSPFLATSCQNLKITEMHFESNSAAAMLTSCINTTVQDVLSALCPPLQINGCFGVSVANYVGGLAINGTSRNTKVCNVRLDGDTFSDLSATSEGIGSGISSASGADFLVGGPGSEPLGNFFHNPYIDIWTAGTSAAPDGFSAVAATFAQETSTTFPLNAFAKAVTVTSTATALNDMTRATPVGPFAATVGARWVSFFTPIYVATGQPNVAVYLFNGSQFVLIEIVTSKNEWVTVRGSALIDATYAPLVVYAPLSGSSFVSGVFRVGGLSMVNGTTSPKSLIDGGRRSEHIVTSVSNAPSFVGQRAYLSGTGKWYMAAATASSADWIILN